MNRLQNVSKEMKERYKEGSKLQAKIEAMNDRYDNNVKKDNNASKENDLKKERENNEILELRIDALQVLYGEEEESSKKLKTEINKLNEEIIKLQNLNENVLNDAYDTTTNQFSQFHNNNDVQQWQLGDDELREKLLVYFDKSDDYYFNHKTELIQALLSNNDEINIMSLKIMEDLDDSDEIFDLSNLLMTSDESISQFIKFIKCKDAKHNLRKSYVLNLLCCHYKIVSAHSDLVALIMELISSSNLDHQCFAIMIIDQVLDYVDKSAYAAKLLSLCHPNTHIEVLEAVASAFESLSWDLSDPDVWFPVELIVNGLNFLMTLDDEQILKMSLIVCYKLTEEDVSLLPENNKKYRRIIREQMETKSNADNMVVEGVCKQWMTNTSIPICVVKLIGKFSAIDYSKRIKAMDQCQHIYEHFIELFKFPSMDVRAKAVINTHLSIIWSHDDNRSESIQMNLNVGMAENLKKFINFDQNEAKSIWCALQIMSFILVKRSEFETDVIKTY